MRPRHIAAENIEYLDTGDGYVPDVRGFNEAAAYSRGKPYQQADQRLVHDTTETLQ